MLRTLQENGKDFVILPLGEYERLIKRQPMSDDAYDHMLGELAMALNEEGFPMPLWEKIDAGTSPIRAFREHRGLTQAALAEKADIKREYISQLENKKAHGTVQTLKRIADALGVPLNHLLD